MTVRRDETPRGALLLAALLVVAFGCREAPPRNGITLFPVTTRDYAFEAPDSVAAGRVRLVMHNEAPSYHHVQILRIDSALSFDEAVASLPENGNIPAGMTPVGGAEGADSIARDVTVDVPLQPGRYLLICRINAPDGKPHSAHGMVRPFVAVASAAEPDLPTADLTIDMADYAFMGPDTLRAGERRILVVNRGPDEHHLAVARLMPGKTLADAMQDPTPGQAPALMVLGGTAGLAAGERNVVHLTLEPGPYALFCFVSTPNSKQMQHYKIGMVRSLTVIAE
jgi:hypothetical protein